ncbi:MAG: D-arabinono-1,4-lactone oxidase [Acidobacteriota bacterium]
MARLYATDPKLKYKGGESSASQFHLKALELPVKANLAPFEAWPHWGKPLSAQQERLPDLYPRFSDFIALEHQCDPEGKFRSAYLERYLLGTAGSA